MGGFYGRMRVSKSNVKIGNIKSVLKESYNYLECVCGGFQPGRKRTAPSLKELFLDQLTCRIVRQRIAQQCLDHQDEVDDGLEPRAQVVDDLLVGVLLEGEEADVAEDGLEGGCRDVRPVEHALELALVDHVLLERGQEDLRGVAEDDDAQGDREAENVDVDRHLGEGPVVDLGEAVADDDGVDSHVHYSVVEAEAGDGAEVL